jgi:hypothetical protein
VLLVGWDWASASHAITIIDAAGRVVDRATLTHTEAELDAALSRLAAHAPACRPARGDPGHRRAGRGPAAGRRAPPSSPCTPPPSTPPGPAGAPRMPSPTPATGQARRGPAHRRPPAAPAATTRCRHPPAASPGPATRRPHRRQDHRQQPALGLLGGHWPAARTLWFRLASPIALDFLTDYPTHRPPPGLPNSSWRGSAAGTPTAAVRPPPSSSLGCTPPPPHPADSTPPCCPSS